MANSRIILVGPTCSGKNYMRDLLVQRGFTYDCGYTTREPRPGELDGREYHFIDMKLFRDMIHTDLMHEWMEYNDNLYGTTKESWTRADVFIMDPEGVSQLMQTDRMKSAIFFLNPDEKIRHARMKERGWDNKQCAARLLQDRERFGEFTDYDVLITNDKF